MWRPAGRGRASSGTSDVFTKGYLAYARLACLCVIVPSRSALAKTGRMSASKSRLVMARHASAIFLLGILANVALTLAMLIKLVGPAVDICAGQGKSEDWSWRLGCWTA